MIEFYDEYSETFVISAMMNEPDTLYEIESLINAEDFYLLIYQTLFTEIRALFNRNTYSFRTLVQSLEDSNQIDKVGGLKTLTEIRNSGGRKYLARWYAERIKTQSLYRQALQISNNIKEAIEQAQEDKDTTDFINKIHGLFYTFNTVRENQMKHVADRVVSAEKQSAMPQISPKIGLDGIDKWMKGVGKERLIVVAGRPGTGKTAFSLFACRNIAKQGFGPVPIFSMEMSGEELVNRMIADMSGVPFARISTNDFQGQQGDVVNRARKQLSELPLYIDDTARMDYEYIVSQCRRLKREHGSLGVVMIDYLGLVKIHEKQNKNKTDAIGELTGDLKRLTRELGCSIILLSQMNRDIEKRANKRPVMSDLRDSGSIEQDADMIIFLHKDTTKSGEIESHIDFIVEKGRQTGVADFELSFNGVIQRFEEKKKI